MILRSTTSRKSRKILLLPLVVCGLLLYFARVQARWSKPTALDNIEQDAAPLSVADVLTNPPTDQRPIPIVVDHERSSIGDDISDSNSDSDSKLKSKAFDTQVQTALETDASRKSVIGKVTISFGEREEVYERAIRSHEYQNERLGYTHFILRERLLPGLWSKHAYIFSVMVQEMAKPEEERLKWLMWLDRDTVLMNPLVPLETFLPPAGFDHVHLLITNDRHGLNNGVFMLKVCEWSLKLFNTALAFRHYNPDFNLKYSEQSAMEEIIKVAWYNQSTYRVPQRWFNAFPPPTEGSSKRFHGKPGSVLLHFASNRDGQRPQRMNQWMDVADQETSDWRVPLETLDLSKEVEEYWTRAAKGDDIDAIIRDIERH